MQVDRPGQELRPALEDQGAHLLGVEPRPRELGLEQPLGKGRIVIDAAEEIRLDLHERREHRHAPAIGSPEAALNPRPGASYA